MAKITMVKPQHEALVIAMMVDEKRELFIGECPKAELCRCDLCHRYFHKDALPVHEMKAHGSS